MSGFRNEGKGMRDVGPAGGRRNRRRGRSNNSSNNGQKKTRFRNRQGNSRSAQPWPNGGLPEQEGLDKIFLEAGFEWREPGCSMCLAMNDDRLEPGERCASTSNRNFEGRQGRGGRTHLVSPAMAAAAAIEGRFTDIRQWSDN